MSEREVLKMLAVAYIILTSIAAWAAWGIWKDWRNERGGESVVFTALVIMDLLTVGAALATMPMAFVFVFDLPPLPLSTFAIVLVLMVMLAAVIVHRLAFDRVKARRGQVREAPSITTTSPPGLATEEPDDG